MMGHCPDDTVAGENIQNSDKSHSLLGPGVVAVNI